MRQLRAIKHHSALFPHSNRMVPAQVALEPHETLFETGDSSEGGIYIVVEGALGVFLAGGDGATRHTNTLHPGESVGDLDVLDGEQLSADLDCTGVKFRV